MIDRFGTKALVANSTRQRSTRSVSPFAQSTSQSVNSSEFNFTSPRACYASVEKEAPVQSAR